MMPRSPREAVPQVQLNAAAHMRTHSSPSMADAASHAKSSAKQLILSLELGLPPNIVVSRIRKLLVLIVDFRSIAPVWQNFDVLANFCAQYRTSDANVLCIFMELLKVTLRTSQDKDPNIPPTHQALNVPTIPSVFMACLRMLPIVVISVDHPDGQCRQMASVTLQHMLVFNRDSPSAMLHRLGILLSQPSTTTTSVVRLGSAHVMVDILCSSKYTPSGHQALRLDENDYDTAVRSLVLSLGDHEPGISAAAEHGLAVLRNGYRHFHRSLQNLPQGYQDQLRLHASAIDQKAKALANSGRNGHGASTTSARPSQRSAPSTQFGAIPSAVVETLRRSSATPSERMEALCAIQNAIDVNMKLRHESLMYHSAHLGGLLACLTEVLLLELPASSSNGVSPQSQQLAERSSAAAIIVQICITIRRLTRFVGLAIKPFFARVLDAAVSMLMASSLHGDRMQNVLRREAVLLLHCCSRTVGPMAIVDHVFNQSGRRQLLVVNPAVGDTATAATSSVLLKVMHTMLRQAGYAVDVTRCVHQFVSILGESTDRNLTAQVLGVLDTLWSIDPSIDFLGIVSSCRIPDQQGWMKHLFERKQRLTSQYLTDDLTEGDSLVLVNLWKNGPVTWQLEDEANSSTTSQTMAPRFDSSKKLPHRGCEEQPPAIESRVTRSPVAINPEQRTNNVDVPPPSHVARSSPKEYVPDERPIKPMGAASALSGSEASIPGTRNDDSDDSWTSGNNRSRKAPRPLKLSAVSEKRRQQRLAQLQLAQGTGDGGDDEMPSPPSTRSTATPRTPHLRARGSRASTPARGGTGQSLKSSMKERRDSNAGGLFQEKEYLADGEILPVDGHPGQEFSRVFGILGNAKAAWSETFQALDAMRRIATHHGDVIERNQLHPLVVAVLAAVKNLRSSVTKNALLCLGDLFRGLGRRMDAELVTILPSLLKKCADTNKFVKAEAQKVMDRLILNCSTSRVLTSLTSMISRPCCKDAKVRAVVALSLRGSLERHNNTCPNQPLVRYLRPEVMASVSRTVVKLATDASADTRLHGGGSLWALIDGGVSAETLKTLSPGTGRIDKALSRSRPARLAIASLDRLDSNTGGQAKTSGTARGRKSSKKATPRRQRQSQNGNGTGGEKEGQQNIRGNAKATLARVEEISKAWLKLKDWQKRVQHLHDLTAVVRGCPQAVLPKIFVVVDVYQAGMADGNSKVAAVALQSLTVVIPLFGTTLAKVLHLLMQPLCNVAATRNSNMYELCGGVLDAIVSTIPTAQAVMALTHSMGKYCKSDAARALLVRKIRKVLSEVMSGSRGSSDVAAVGKVLQKKLVPLAYSLLGPGGGSLRSELEQLIQVLWRVNRTACDKQTALSSPRTAKMSRELQAHARELLGK